MTISWFSWFFEEPQMWATIAVLSWIYLNLGWRFAEYKLNIASTWRKKPAVLLHLLWPVEISNRNCYCLAKPGLGWFTGELANENYKFFSMLFLGPAILWNIVVISFLWLLWFMTWGRLKPIHANTFLSLIRNS